MFESLPKLNATARVELIIDGRLIVVDVDFASFGRIVEGLEVIDDLVIGDRIEDGEVIEGLENLVLEEGTPPEKTIGNFSEKIGTADRDI